MDEMISKGPGHRPNFSLKEDIRDYWSSRAASFDLSAAHKIDDRYGMPEWQRLLREAFALGRWDDLDGLRALDIACGTGEISRMLCGFGADVTAIDFSEEMLARAREKLATHKWSGLLMDAENLNLLPDAAFDVAVTRHLVWTLTDPDAAFREWRRVIKPGGRLLIVDGDWTRMHGGLMQSVRNWIAARIGTRPHTDSVDTERHQDILRQLHYSDGLTQQQAIEGLREAGFERFRPLSVRRLYRAGMRGASLGERLRLSSAGRFALVAS